LAEQEWRFDVTRAKLAGQISAYKVHKTSKMNDPQRKPGAFKSLPEHFSKIARRRTVGDWVDRGGIPMAAGE